MIDEKCARLWAKNARYKKKIGAANKIIEDSLKVCDRPFVACSFGKDSAVLLDLVMKIIPDVEARFVRWPETNIINNYDEVISQWIGLGANVKILDLSRESLDDKVGDRWDQLSKISYSDGSFVGLRADESKGRRMTLIANGVIYKSVKGFYRICPLASWKNEDIAAHVVSNNLPTLNTYKEFGYQTRTAARIPRADFHIREQMLRDLKARDIIAFNELQKIYGEVSEYA